MNITSQIKYLLRFVLSNRAQKYSKTVQGMPSFSANQQDVAVRTIFGNKIGGTYIEIGSQDPIKNSNTFILERDLGWKGLSFEIDRENAYFFNRSRKNPCVLGDATKHDYAALLSQHDMPHRIDYLQVDIDPAQASLAALLSLPLDTHRFSFITFEHDGYSSESSVESEQRALLISKGYELVAKNVMASGQPFEDWWIDPVFWSDRFSKRAPAFEQIDYAELVSALQKTVQNGAT